MLVCALGPVLYALNADPSNVPNSDVTVCVEARQDTHGSSRRIFGKPGRATERVLALGR